MERITMKLSTVSDAFAASRDREQLREGLYEVLSELAGLAIEDALARFDRDTVRRGLRAAIEEIDRILGA